MYENIFAWPERLHEWDFVLLGPSRTSSSGISPRWSRLTKLVGRTAWLFHGWYIRSTRAIEPIIRSVELFVRSAERIIRSVGLVIRSAEPTIRSAGLVVRSAKPISRSVGLVVRSTEPISRSVGPCVRCIRLISLPVIWAHERRGAGIVEGLLCMRRGGRNKSLRLKCLKKLND